MEHNGQPRNKPALYGQLIYDKGIKSIQWGKTISSVNAAGKTEELHVKE